MCFANFFSLLELPVSLPKIKIKMTRIRVKSPGQVPGEQVTIWKFRWQNKCRFFQFMVKLAHYTCSESSVKGRTWVPVCKHENRNGSKCCMPTLLFSVQKSIFDKNSTTHIHIYKESELKIVLRCCW